MYRMLAVGVQEREQRVVDLELALVTQLPDRNLPARQRQHCCSDVAASSLADIAP